MSQVASAISQKETHKSMPWRYSLIGDRDLRIDFMRGIALVMMVVAHTEVMSIFNIFSWERFGLTTGAEGFDPVRLHVRDAKSCQITKGSITDGELGALSSRMENISG